MQKQDDNRIYIETLENIIRKYIEEHQNFLKRGASQTVPR